MDGGFRVCCLLTILKFCDEGTKIVFDADTNRKCYHIVEKILKLINTSKIQQLFIVNNKSKINVEKLDIRINGYTKDMD
jgi:hypothetical protein